MTEEKFNCDFLRPIEHLTAPDPRNKILGKLDLQTKAVRPLNPQDMHDAVSRYKLHENVPENIVIQFETAKNLYQYAWFVYRFYPLVYTQAFACLELALRTVYGEEIPKKEYYPNQRNPGLYALLKYAIDKDDIRNEGFQEWFRHAEMTARRNYEITILEEMIEQDLSSKTWDDNDFKVEDHDLEWNYVEYLLNTIPKTRNHYAHGSSDLHTRSLESIHVTSEIINQIF